MTRQGSGQGDEGERKGLTRKQWMSELGVPRAQRVELYNGLRERHLIASPEEEGAFFQELLEYHAFPHCPKNGWAFLAYELRLIELDMPDVPKPGTKGRADLREDCQKIADAAWDLIKQVSVLTQSDEAMVAQMLCEVRAAEAVLPLIKLRKDMDALITHFKDMKQPPKWRQSKLREIRVELAVKLTALFEQQFGIEAKPVGGSASLPLNETNDWTRFYQAIASVFLRETVTPDRQWVLWEAVSACAVGYSLPRLSSKPRQS